jgi:hypothetical protein
MLESNREIWQMLFLKICGNLMTRRPKYTYFYPFWKNIHQLATMDVMWEGNTFFIILLSNLLIIHILSNNHMV